METEFYASGSKGWLSVEGEMWIAALAWDLWEWRVGFGFHRQYVALYFLCLKLYVNWI